MGNQLNKAAKITFNINCVICSLGAFYSIIDALRAIAGNASNPLSVIAAPSFVISLYALYLFYNQKKNRIIFVHDIRNHWRCMPFFRSGLSRRFNYKFVGVCRNCGCSVFGY